MPQPKHNSSHRPTTLARRLLALDKTFEKLDSTAGTIRREQHEHVLRMFEALDLITQQLDGRHGRMV